MDISDVSITSWWVRGALALFAIAALAGAARRGSRARRLSCAGVGLVLLVAFAASWVNAHFDYYPTVGDLFGRTAADEASVDSLSRSDVPDNGEVVHVPIPGARSGFPGRPAQVFVPPAWFGTPKPRLPVILMLHGSPGAPEDWTRGGLADQTADQFAADNKGVAPILVMPDVNGGLTTDTECVDSPRGNAETYLTVDVRRAVIERFQTATDARSWAVAGFSEGGSCATVLGLRHPDLFATFADYGGLAGPRSGENNDLGSTVSDLFGGSQAALDAHEPQKLLEGRRYAEMGAWFESARDDPAPVTAAELLAPMAKAAGLDVCLVVLPSGDHTFVAWTQAFRDSLPWMAARLGLVPRSPAQTRLCQPLG